MSLPLSNLNLFREGINQQLRQETNAREMMPQVDIDLVVTVADLGQDLFDELRQLEPYGMGNPIPKLLIKNCWFKNAWNKNIQDRRGQKIQYIKTTFKICDDSTDEEFPGLWWGHYKDEIPVTGRCDAIAELDFNTFNKRYEIRLVALRPTTESTLDTLLNSAFEEGHQLIDRRLSPQSLDDLEVPLKQASLLQQCPDSWSNLRREYRQATQSDRSLVLAYKPDDTNTMAVWQQLVGIAKYLSRTEKPVTKSQIASKLNLSDRSVDLGLKALSLAGFKYRLENDSYHFVFDLQNIPSDLNSAVNSFLLAIEEEKFQQQYFYRVPLSIVNQQLNRI